jgi:hypothetical protein
MVKYFVSGLAVCASFAAVAQTGRSMPANTSLTVTPLVEISSKKIETGQMFDFVTVGDVSEGGTVVVPRGSPVKGEITFKTGRAIGGKSGKFEVTFRSVQVRGINYNLAGVHRQEGKGNTVAAVFASIWVSGRSAVMIPGQEVKALTAAAIPY